MSARKRVAVLISGRGSNLQALIDAASLSGYPAEIALVISNVADAPGLGRAEAGGIATKTIPHRSYPSREAFDAVVDAALRDSGAEIVCLAGFTRIVSDAFARSWEGRIINIHPSLLPAFKGYYGNQVHRQVLESGVRISGCTVHFVVPELDSGPIIAQAAVPVLSTDTEDSLGARTLAAEHRLYPLALKMLAEERVRLLDNRAAFSGPVTASGALFSPSA